MICAYCGGNNMDGGKCLGCGGRSTEKTVQQRREEWEPFFYNGFIVIPIGIFYDDFGFQRREYHFHLGNELIDVVYITRELWRALFPDDFSVSFDPMPIIWELFLVQQGDKRDIIFERAKHNKDVFDGRKELAIITRRETYEEVKDEYSGMSFAELLKLKEQVTQ